MQISGAGAIVSGGASGLGAATARRLAADGALVTILDRNGDLAESLAKELGGGAKAFAADVADADAVSEAIAIAAEEAPLRIAVNCAGIGIATRVVDRNNNPHPLEHFEFVLRVNLIGTFNVLRLAASQMAKADPLEDNERGVIVNTASIAAFDGQIGQTAYSASKGGIVGLTLPAARDLAPVGIRVVTIAPGTFDTPLLAGLPEEARTALGNGIPFPKRLGQPEEFADLVAHICTNRVLNGEVIRLDGALRMPPK